MRKSLLTTLLVVSLGWNTSAQAPCINVPIQLAGSSSDGSGAVSNLYKLQGHWDFQQDTDAAHMRDLSGRANHLALNGGYTILPYGVHFDGLSGYGEVPAASLSPVYFESGPEMV